MRKGRKEKEGQLVEDEGRERGNNEANLGGDRERENEKEGKLVEDKEREAKWKKKKKGS